MMLDKLYIIAEGRSECAFIKNVLAEHLLDFHWLVTSVTLPTGSSATGIKKGG